MLNSPELEKQLLSALIKYPNSFSVISPLISEDDFYTAHGSYVHQTIFKMIKRSQESGSGEVLDEVILIERLKAASVSFVDNIDIGDYIRGLLLKKTSEESVLSIALELQNFTVRREITAQCGSISDEMKKMVGVPVPDVIRTADKLYNDKIDFYSKENIHPENIYDDIGEVLEDLADNPADPGMMAPHMPYLNRLYGSLLRPGNISVICARTGVGKTTFCLDFVTKISAANDNVPILHFDNGEMTKQELQMRQASALSGVPMYLIESGKWKNSSYIDPATQTEYSAEQTRAKVVNAVKIMKDRKFYYYDVAGLTVNEIVQVARRFYLSKVGRGKPMILSFDYIKTTNEMSNSNKSSWDLIGEMVDKFKQFIKKEMTFNNRPMIGMITSVQSNRTGIVGNRGPDAIIEDDSIIAGSDKINSFCSHLFILRPRLAQELQLEPSSYGRATHRLKCVKHRHLGEDRQRATEHVLIPSLDDDGEAVGNNRSESNALMLRIDNFGVEEVGDLRDLADQMRTQGITPDEDGDFI
tara:strand:- start:26456 stop:28039 length:1584 start_codon:yes stop_codon:yes gene_type:complete